MKLMKLLDDVPTRRLSSKTPQDLDKEWIERATQIRIKNAVRRSGEYYARAENTPAGLSLGIELESIRRSTSLELQALRNSSTEQDYRNLLNTDIPNIRRRISMEVETSRSVLGSDYGSVGTGNNSHRTTSIQPPLPEHADMAALPPQESSSSLEARSEPAAAPYTTPVAKRIAEIGDAELTLALQSALEELDTMDPKPSPSPSRAVEDADLLLAKSFLSPSKKGAPASAASNILALKSPSRSPRLSRQ